MSAEFEVAPFGDRAILISSSKSLLGFQGALEPFGRVRAGITSLLIEGVDPQRCGEIESLLLQTEPTSFDSVGRLLEIPVRYDGEDLAGVAALLKKSEDEVVAAHTGALWTVAMVGFSPGFGYLTTTDTDLFNWIPRLDTPRTKVPAGSLAVAAGMSAIYPSASPGGWRLIGSSSVQLFDATDQKPSLLSQGDTVRFVRA